MSQEEPAWRAELREAIHRWDEREVEAPLRMQGVQQATLIPHIQAAEERGRREALRQARCLRCAGSGIDPEYSSPATGPSEHSMGEPEALEPCIACQYPDKP